MKRSICETAMQEYIVRAGDTLSAIAKRFLGANADWREIARINNITNPASLQIGQKLLIPVVTPPSARNPEVAMVRNTLQGVYPPNKIAISFTTVGSDVIAKLLNTGQQEPFAKTRDLGLYRLGIFKLRDFIAYGSGLLQQVQMSPSEIKVMLVTSANEGSLDAINTWDSQYLSFGIFQWTLGAAEQQGELPALLNNLKRRYPSEFQYYFGQFGLDVTSLDGITGWMSLNGNRLVSAADKNLMRQPLWALRFAIAGMDALVQSVQVVHAISRLDRFYFTPTQTLQGFTLSQILSSEFAVALLLDHHVNRPSHVIPCVADAIARSRLTPAQVAQGSTDNEALIIQNYLALRETFGGASAMTKSRERAELARQSIATGNLSPQRFSFRSNRQSRST
ncbi:LysM peptidoglycan-binding domain-containing protein [Pseudanabaena sp. UWO311]|uniref:LysM peptidoglycan-binding domain-containing protein n=2 Tax=Pseudanabaena sp. UWO311 TaxID=2487337 RepID=UPI0030DAA5BA